MPHFHVEGRGFRASVGIATLTVIVGHVSARPLKEALDWAAGHQAELLATWQELNG